MTLCDKCVKQTYCDIYEDIMNYEQDSECLPNECMWFKPYSQDQNKELESEPEKKEPCQECKWYEMSNQEYFLHNCFVCKKNDYMYFKPKT